MASAFLRHFLRLHLDEQKAKEAADQLLGVIEVMYVYRSFRRPRLTIQRE